MLDATGTERAVVVGALDGQPAGPRPRRRPPGAGRRLGRDRAGDPGPGAVPARAAGVVRPVGRGHRRRRGLGSLQPVLLAARLSRLPRLLLRPAGARGALDQADRGPRGVGPGHRRRDAGPGRGRVASRASARCEEQCAAVRCPVVVVHGTDDRVIPYDARSTPGGADRRDAGDLRGHRPRPPGQGAGGPQPGARRRPDRGHAGRGRASAGSGRRDGPSGCSTCRPRSGSDTSAATSPSPTSCASSIRAWRSSGSRSRRSPTSWSGPASASTRRRPGWRARAATSSPSPASTTCTPSRRSAGWTRSWSPTSWSSTTWSASATTTSGSATRRGTSTTSCTRTRASSARRSPG